MACIIEVYLNLGMGDSHTTATGIYGLATGTWQHVALTWNNGSFAVYVSVSRRAGSYTGLATNYGIAAIGNGYVVSNQSWSGVIDDVRLYNRALSASEVAALAVTGGGGTKSADLNGDGIVNSLDWSIMNAAWLSANASADLNSDGVVNSFDWSIMNSKWGTSG